jgi:hypothetical protein
MESTGLIYQITMFIDVIFLGKIRDAGYYLHQRDGKFDKSGIMGMMEKAIMHHYRSAFRL